MHIFSRQRPVPALAQQLGHSSRYSPQAGRADRERLAAYLALGDALEGENMDPYSYSRR